MNFKYLSGDIYRVSPKPFSVKWDGSCASKFQAEVKSFFYKFWKNDFCCEEFPCKPTRDKNLRFDLINLDRKIVVEAQHLQHAQFNKKFHRNHDDFYKQIMHDKLKELWCQTNGYKFIEIFPHHVPIKLHDLLSKYGRIH